MGTCCSSKQGARADSKYVERAGNGGEVKSAGGTSSSNVPAVGDKEAASKKANASRKAPVRDKGGLASMVLRCSERAFEGADKHLPTKLVVFDLDETITMATFMPKNHKWDPAKYNQLTEYNFESPWLAGSRVDNLKKMFANLASGGGSTKENKAQEPKTLAILSRNEAGVKNVLQLLKMVGFDSCFSCIWTLPWDEGSFNGAFRVGQEWEYFNPPLRDINDHKADVLHHLCSDPSAYFPQLRGESKAEVVDLANLQPEQIILVDDQRNNFMSESGKRLLRFAKVARYEAHYRQAGVIHDMGGIGAHDVIDFDNLQKFVRMPWEFPETIELNCWERKFGDAEYHRSVKLVIFDFDETLTLATFTPNSDAFFTEVGFAPKSNDSEWTAAQLVEYNFESPFTAEENRVDQLKDLCKRLIANEGGSTRTLAILARSPEGAEPRGAVAVLNLLMMAGLAEYFTAIWAMPATDKYPSGVYKDGDGWKVFSAPIGQVPDHKAEALDHLRANPEAWFPQFATLPQKAELQEMNPEGIVLVDDERANFRSTVGGKAKVIRVAKVARYDKEYRDCGLLLEMGGLGAHNQTDYNVLCDFVARPWDFPKEGHHGHEATKEAEKLDTIDVQSPQATMTLTRQATTEQAATSTTRAKRVRKGAREVSGL